MLNAVELIATREIGKSPTCPDCGYEHVRPSIVPFFGSPERTQIEDVFEYCQKGVDYLFVVGTQLTFAYIENILYYVRRYNPDAVIININPEITPCQEGFDILA